MATSLTTAKNRAQDTFDIASILMSMNEQSNVTSEQGGGLARPVDFSAPGEPVVTMAFEDSRELSSQPDNLATSAGGQQIQVQSIKGLSQGTPESMMTKKDIIATM